MNIDFIGKTSRFSIVVDCNTLFDKADKDNSGTLSGKELLVQLLSELGEMIQAITNWLAEVKGREINQAGMKQLMGPKFEPGLSEHSGGVRNEMSSGIKIDCEALFRKADNDHSETLTCMVILAFLLGDLCGIIRLTIEGLNQVREITRAELKGILRTSLESEQLHGKYRVL